MFQLLKFDSPIPSCSIYELEFKDGKWYYIYALNTPFELTNDNEMELIVYEYISDLYLRLPESVHPESVNLRIKTLDQYLKLLEMQKNEDKKYREYWLSKNPEAKPNTIQLENKSYTHDELTNIGVNYIASIYEFEDGFTSFAAI